jgi:hypothetical protein
MDVAASVVKFVADRSFADPDAAARKLVEIANATHRCKFLRSDRHFVTFR